jgi:hypothetical protein
VVHLSRRTWCLLPAHTTPEIPLHWSPAASSRVLGLGYDAITDEQRAAVVEAHPRPNFKNEILAAFTDGIKERAETTFGNVKADVLEHFVPGFERGDFVEVILGFSWPE